MRKSVQRLLVTAVLAGAVLHGCGVKEDRGPCPCILKLDLSEAFPEGRGPLLLSLRGEDDFRYCDTLAAENFPDPDKEYSVRIPDGRIVMDVYSPYDCLSSPYEGYRPQGKCGAIWSQSEIFSAEGESVRRKIVLQKNHCLLRVSFTGSLGTGDFLPVFRSSVDGYLPGGALSPGNYSEQAEAGADGAFCLNLLRQGDSSMMMDIFSAGSGTSGTPLTSVAVGEYIAASGYDWNASSLADMEIEVDFAMMEIVMRSEKWERIVRIDVGV